MDSSVMDAGDGRGAMPVIISHCSALELLRAVPPQARLYPRVGEPLEMTGISTSPQELATLDLGRFGVRRKPVHVLVSGESRELKASGVRTHWFGLPVMPGGLLLELSPGVYVEGPELCFVQMARSTSIVGAVVLGYELCGQYSHFSEMVSGYYERPPLTSVEMIGAAMSELSGLYGLGRAREALRWVRDGARSPMETVLAGELFLPGRHKGLAFVRPELNYEVSLDEAASAITGTKTCRIDVAWPGQRRGTEYDSREFHLDPEKDLRRKEALEHMGWTINTIKLDHMANHDELMKAVALFEDAIPRQKGGPASAEEVAQLHERLLRATRCGMGMERAVFGVPVPHGLVKMHLGS